MRTLVFKELRDVAGITAAALAAYTVLVVSLMGAKVFDWIPGMPRGTQGVPFIDGGFTSPFMFLSALFALALGFRQSAWESARGTYLYLLHLPRSRAAIFCTKLATGIGVLLVSGALPIVAYATWAATPGRHAGPFTWAMTGPAWALLLVMPVLYLGAFLSGIRPGWWFGTRLLPLVGTVVLAMMICQIPEWWQIGLLPGLCVLLVGNTCHVARMRDYA